MAQVAVGHAGDSSPIRHREVVIEVNFTEADKDLENDTLPRDELKNGPISDRSCTDVLCCLILAGFICAMVYIGRFGYLNGDYTLLLTTFDADGLGCGWNETTKDYPYVYWPIVDLEAAQSLDPEFTDIMNILGRSTCVKECPTAELADPVQCVEPDFMTSPEGREYYLDCMFYVNSVPYTELELNQTTTCVDGAPRDLRSRSCVFRYET